MKIPKKILLMSALLACSAVAQAETIPGITVKMSTGEKVSFAFVEHPKIVKERSVWAREPNYLVVYTKGEKRLKYLLEKTAELTFEEVDIATSIKPSKVVKGDENHVVFKINDAGFVAAGLKKGEKVKIYSSTGELVCSAKADSNGVAEVSLSSYPQGVYVVNTSRGVSYKFINNK